VIGDLKASREAAGLTLADVSVRCGIDEAVLARVENGNSRNPDLDTLWRYAAAVGKRLLLSAEDVQDTRQVAAKARRSGPKKPVARKKRA
jgi:transcriptional regulator with XRE-family HTH domain